MFQSITLENFLSFRGPTTIECGKLNVLIGANGVGKSNFLNALQFLSQVPEPEFFESAPPDRLAGRYLWSGESDATHITVGAKIPFLARLFDYVISLDPFLGISSEGLSVSRKTGADQVVFSVNEGSGKILTMREGKPALADIDAKSFNSERSVLSQFSGDQFFPQLIQVKSAFKMLSLYRDWDTSANGSLRNPQPIDQPRGRLTQSGSNLALVLQRILKDRGRQEIETWLRRFNPRHRDIEWEPIGRNVSLFFRESGLESPVSSQAVSDGTLQFLCLLAILMDRRGGAVVCLEEPEKCLHPDAIILLADLLKESSEHMQIFVTTHSDRLIDCFSDMPEAVMVADRDPETGETQLERLHKDELDVWLKNYRLGKLWTKGQIGGVTA